MADMLPEFDRECFFISPIGGEGTAERNRSDGILEFIVQEAASELGLIAIRADQIAQPGQITLQVLDHVLGARVAVADLTGLNPNVFYELAVRHTARLPVVLIVAKGQALPFDIAQMRAVFFDHTDLRSATECKKAIVSQLNEALAGAVDSPIATAVDVKALQGGNTVERNTAELVQGVEELAQMQGRLFDIVAEVRTSMATRSTIDPEAVRAIDVAFGQAQELSELFDEGGNDEMARRLLEVSVPLEYARDLIVGCRTTATESGREQALWGRRVEQALAHRTAAERALRGRVGRESQRREAPESGLGGP